MLFRVVRNYFRTKTRGYSAECDRFLTYFVHRVFIRQINAQPSTWYCNCNLMFANKTIFDRVSILLPPFQTNSWLSFVSNINDNAQNWLMIKYDWNRAARDVLFIYYYCYYNFYCYILSIEKFMTFISKVLKVSVQRLFILAAHW